MNHQGTVPTKTALVEQFAGRQRVMPVKGDVICWTEHCGGRTRTYTGKVHTVHPDRWLVNLGAGRYHSLTQAVWAQSGEVVQAAGKPQLALVTA